MQKKFIRSGQSREKAVCRSVFFTIWQCIL